MWLPYVAGSVGGTDGDAHSPENPEGRAGGGNMRAVSHFRILVLNREKAILLDFPSQHCGVVMRGVGHGGGGVPLRTSLKRGAIWALPQSGT